MSGQSKYQSLECLHASAEVRSAYIHVPFCAHRCGYCDFTLITDRDDLITNYLLALERELQNLQHPGLLNTLYLGGGTPSYLQPDQLRRLFALLRRWFDLAADAEFTFEANPIDLDQQKISVLKDAGVNRISLGVQSFHAEALRMLERDHTPYDIHLVHERLQQQIPNISFDLIFAVPGQSISIWSETLDEAIALGPRHISTYCLTYEKGTAFWSRRKHGSLHQTSDDTEREMYALAIEKLQNSDYEHYEVSSFARSGCRSRHNQIYWQDRPYYGFGPGAARYLDGVRQTNHRSVTTWIKKVLSTGAAIMESVQLDPEERAIERLLLGLRQRDGIDVNQFATETGLEIMQLRPAVINDHLTSGMLELNENRLRLTEEGLFFADSVIVDLM